MNSRTERRENQFYSIFLHMLAAISLAVFALYTFPYAAEAKSYRTIVPVKFIPEDIFSNEHRYSNSYLEKKYGGKYHYLGILHGSHMIGYVEIFPSKSKTSSKSKTTVSKKTTAKKSFSGILPQTKGKSSSKEKTSKSSGKSKSPQKPTSSDKPKKPNLPKKPGQSPGKGGAGSGGGKSSDPGNKNSGKPGGKGNKGNNGSRSNGSGKSGSGGKGRSPYDPPSKPPVVTEYTAKWEIYIYYTGPQVKDPCKTNGITKPTGSGNLISKKTINGSQLKFQYSFNKPGTYRVEAFPISNFGRFNWNGKATAFNVVVPSSLVNKPTRIPPIRCAFEVEHFLTGGGGIYKGLNNKIDRTPDHK